MPTLGSLLFFLVLLLAGGYAGMVLMVWVGVLPGLRLLSPRAFADAWRAMDRFMGRAMPPYKGALLLLSLAASIVLTMAHRMPLAIAVGASLLLSLAGLALTVRGQLPLNARLHALPTDSPDDVLNEIRDRTVRGMLPRLVLAVAAFAVLGIGAVLWPISWEARLG